MSITLLSTDTVSAAIPKTRSRISQRGYLTAQLTALGTGVVGGEFKVYGTNDGLGDVEILTLTLPATNGGGSIAVTTKERYYFDELSYSFTPSGAGQITQTRGTVNGSGV